MQHAVLLKKMEDQAETWRMSGDNRYYFLACYSRMTRRMLDAVAGGSFQDAAWVEQLLFRFTDYYFEPLRAFNQGGQTAPVWQKVHALTLQENMHHLQQLLIGVNAHINYDLVLTLRDMLDGEWATLSDHQRALRYQDHCTVNTIIEKTVDEVQDEILEPGSVGMQLVDNLFGRLDEYLISKLISSWREQVWQHTITLLDMPNDQARSTYLKQIEDEVNQRTVRIARI